MAEMKSVTFTLRATVEQSVRWKLAAEREGFPSVGTWAAGALDAYLKHQARAGRPLPLSWRRSTFPVRFESGDVLTVKGYVSPPFFAYRGGADRQDRYSNHYSLIYQPDGKLIATLRSYRQCRALASEMAAALLRGNLPDPSALVEQHRQGAS